MKVPKETYSTFAPQCPHCDHFQDHDGDFYYDESMTSTECESCGEKFNMRVYHSTSWTCSE